MQTSVASLPVKWARLVPLFLFFRLACDFGLDVTDAGHHANARVLDFNGTVTLERNHISVSGEAQWIPATKLCLNTSFIFEGI